MHGSNVALRSGDTFRLLIDVPQRSHLYVMHVDGAGITSRLYPAVLTGGENPVQGRVEIPSRGQSAFVLDDATGLERVLAFAQADPSPALEGLAREVGAAGESQQPTRTLTRGIKVLRAVAQQDDTGHDAVASRSNLGGAAVELVIDHR